MFAILEVAVLVFSSISLLTLGLWIFRRGWHICWRATAILFVVSLWWAMVNGPLQGHYGSDHGVLSGILATFGVAAVVNWAIRRYNQSWYPWAITGVSLLFLVLVWRPRFDANRQATAQAIVRFQTDGPHRTTGSQAPAPTGAHRISCESLSPQGRVAAGCQ